MTGAPGETIGKYQVIRSLASGSQGVVYLAHDPELDRQVALKVLHPHLATPEVVTRFRREAQIVASINHPYIAGIAEIGEHNGSHFIVIDYVPHGASELMHRGPLDIERAVSIAHQSALALEAARTSRRGITHHDIKPENLLLTTLGADGMVKLIDFGIAHAADMAPMTQAGSQWGTPFYMPPEQWNGERGDTRSDVYSLGIVLYQMLSGRVPFNSTAANSVVRQTEIARQHLEDVPTSLGSIREGIPEALEAVVAKCMAKSPEDRYQTPGELADALAAMFGLAAPTASETSLRPPVETSGDTRPPPRNRLPLIAAGGFGAMIVISLVVLVALQPEDNPSPPAPVVMVPSATETPTPTYTPIPTETPLPAPTRAPAPIATPEATPTPVPTPTPYPIQPTFTPLPTSTPRPTPTHLPSSTPRPTFTPTRTPLPTATPQPTVTPTATPVPIATNTPTPAPTSTPVSTPTPTPTPILSDLTVGSVSISTATPAIFEDMSFTASVSNLGTAPAGEFTVGLYDGDQVLDEHTIIRLISGGVEEVTLVWRAEAQARTLNVIVDPGNRISEYDYGNNSQSVRVAPLTPPYHVDRISWEPEKPEIDQRVTFWAHIENKGDRRVRYDAGIAFYLDGEFHSWSGLEKVEGRAIEQIDSDTWKAKKGDLDVTVVVYPLGYFNYDSNPSWKELDERYAIAVEHASYNATRLPNLTVTGVEFSQRPVAGTETFYYMDTRVSVLNEIGKDGLRPPSVKEPFDVAVEYESGPACPFEPIGSCVVILEVEELRGGSGVSLWARGENPLPLPRSDSVHEYRIVVTVDPDNDVDESDETDNIKRITNRVTNN